MRTSSQDGKGTEKSTLAERETKSQMGGRELTFLFVVAYIAHGIAAQFGLIAQPIQYFMMKGLHLTAAQISAYLSVMMLPWVLKPLYGLICDFVPFLGYRRKSYLIAANLLTAIAFAVMSLSNSLSVVLVTLVLSAVGMAISTAVTVGMATELGRDDDKAREYFALQTLCYYCALIAASLGGGLLCHLFTPQVSLHIAAGVAVIPVLAVACFTAVKVREPKTVLNMQGIRDTGASLRQALTCRSLWLVALFIWCWDFSPSFGVPLYFYESNSLGFAQETIGQLAAWNAAGMVVGSLLYRLWIGNRTTKTQLYLAVAAGSLSTLAYLLLSTPAAAVILEICRGLTNMIAILAIYGLSADVCPARTEVSVMAALIAVRNLATEFSTFVGGQLFTFAFHNQLAPLVLVAAATTALCLLLIPFLPDRSSIPEQNE